MGSGSFDREAATRRINLAGGSANLFDHDRKVRSGAASGAHEDLLLKNKPIRECRYSADSPNATPVVLVLDVTGSMSSLPKRVLGEMPKAFGAIQDQASIKDPQLLVAAVGDSYSDKAPFQVGEFEADDELIEAQTAKIYCEGNGGGQSKESYGLPIHFLARQVEADCFQDGRKGLAFIVCDEDYYSTITNVDMEWLGLEPGTPVMDITELVEEAKTHWNLYVVRPTNNGYFTNSSISQRWKDLVGEENVLAIDSPDEISSLMAGVSASLAGLDPTTTVNHLRDAGLKVGDHTSRSIMRITPSEIETIDANDGSEAVVQN